MGRVEGVKLKRPGSALGCSAIERERERESLVCVAQFREYFMSINGHLISNMTSVVYVNPMKTKRIYNVQYIEEFSPYLKDDTTQQ
jgi:hypothetical protein